MAVADPAAGDGDIGESEAGGGGGLAEGAGILDLFDKGDGGGGGGKKAVDPQVARALCPGALAGQEVGEAGHGGVQAARG